MFLLTHLVAGGSAAQPLQRAAGQAMAGKHASHICLNLRHSLAANLKAGRHSRAGTHPGPPGAAEPAQQRCCLHPQAAAPAADRHYKQARTAPLLQPPPWLQWAARARQAAAASCRSADQACPQQHGATAAPTGQTAGHQSGRSVPGSAAPASSGYRLSKGAAPAHMRPQPAPRQPAAPPHPQNRAPGRDTGTGCRRRGSIPR